MANALYSGAKQAFLSAGLDLTTVTVKVVLLKNTYTFSAAHANFSDLSTNFLGTFGGSGNFDPKTLGTKSVTSGVFDAADSTFTAVTAGSTVTGLAIFKDTGTNTTSTLIAYIDTTGSGAISVATNGGDISVAWDNGTNKIFSL